MPGKIYAGESIYAGGKSSRKRGGRSKSRKGGIVPLVVGAGSRKRGGRSKSRSHKSGSRKPSMKRSKSRSHKSDSRKPSMKSDSRKSSRKSESRKSSHGSRKGGIVPLVGGSHKKSRRGGIFPHSILGGRVKLHRPKIRGSGSAAVRSAARRNPWLIFLADWKKSGKKYDPIEARPYYEKWKRANGF